MKLTKRKAFKFFRSYYDVYNELEKDKDKLAFIEALLDKQFLGVDPTDLKGMVKFAYISQVNSIDSQVTGYETKTKTKLGGCVGGKQGATLQEKEEVQEEEKVKDEQAFFIFWDKYPNKVAKGKCKEKFLKLNDSDKQQILNTIDEYIRYKPFKDYNHPNPETYLNQKRWLDELPKGIIDPLVEQAKLINKRYEK